MFDPTIFDNLKTVMEGSIYDMDLAGDIHITDRKDLVDLSTMSRKYSIRFERRQSPNVYAEVQLTASLQDLSLEILELEGLEQAGCEFTIHFCTTIENEKTCDHIETELSRIWEGRPAIVQRLSFTYAKHNNQPRYDNDITLNFDRKINENQIPDFPRIFSTMIQSLECLGSLSASSR